MTNSITLKKTGSPTIFLWGDYREKEDFNRYSSAKDTESQEMYFTLIDCIYKIVSSSRVESEDIELFKKAIEYKTKLVWEKAGEKSVQFSHYFVEFASLLDKLAQDKQAEIRRRIIQFHWRDFPPQEQAFRILTSGLKDTSRKNREFTIDRIQYFNLKEFLPVLKAVVEAENDTKVKGHLQDTICLLEQGYYMKEFNDKKVSVTFHHKGLKSFLMPKEELTEGFIRKEIDKRRSD